MANSEPVGYEPSGLGNGDSDYIFQVWDSSESAFLTILCE